MQVTLQVSPGEAPAGAATRTTTACVASGAIRTGVGGEMRVTVHPAQLTDVVSAALTSTTSRFLTENVRSAVNPAATNVAGAGVTWRFVIVIPVKKT